MEEENNKSKKATKKPLSVSSASAIKVYQIQMKSKAAGDTKCIKVPDRFYFELITIVDDKNDSIQATSSGCFLAKTDPIQRIESDCCRTVNKR